MASLGGPCWPKPRGTHHGAHHPADVDRVVAAGAVPVLVPQELGVCVQQVEADGQDVFFKLVQREGRKHT